MKKWAIGFGIVFVLGFVAFELVSTFQQAQKREVIRTVQATDFTLPTLDDQKQTLFKPVGRLLF